MQQEAPDQDVERDEDGESRRMASYWKTMIEDVDEVQSNWYERGEKIGERYRDERSSNEKNDRRMNLLWTNTQILTPAVYSAMPMVIIERRFLDHDPVGRMSAQIWERVTRNELKENGFHRVMQRAVSDYLLPGRGQAWVRYEPEFGPSVSIPIDTEQDMVDELGHPLEVEADEGGEGDEQEDKLQDTGEQIIAESVPVDYIHWKDFYIFPARARTWTEVQAIGKRLYLSKQQCIEQFGEKIGSQIHSDTSLEHKARQSLSDPTTVFDSQERKRVVFEIWNKADRKVYWVSTGYHSLCKVKDDPLGLKGFFPVPEPLSAVMTNDTMVPVPLYIEWQDQALQIDQLTQRIAMLAKCIKAAGTYDASNRALKRLLDEATENELIPVEDWHRHQDKGGVEGGISFLPIRDMVEALQVLVELRAKILEDLDRVTGISDVLRGTTDARETMGGQRLKQNNANTRIDQMRAEVARFARDIIALVAEVEAKKFTNKTLVECSGILYEEGISPDDLEDLQSQLDGANTGMPAAPPASAGATGMPPPPMGGIPPHLPPSPMAGPPPTQPGPGAPGMPGSGGARPGLGAPPQAPGPVGVAGQPGGAPPPPPPAPPPSPLSEVANKMRRIGKALELLKKDVTRGYRIEIETDSTVAGDIQEERDGAVQFVTAVSKFLETAQMLGGANPEIVPLLGKIMQFAVRKFRTGRDLESAIDEFVDHTDKKARAMAANPQPKPPTDEQIKQQTEMMKQKAELDKMHQQAALQAQDDQRQAQMQQQNDQRDAQIQQMQDQRDAQLKDKELQARLQELEMEARYREREMQMNLEFKQREHEWKMEQLEVQRVEAEKDRAEAQKDREHKAAERKAKAKTTKSAA